MCAPCTNLMLKEISRNLVEECFVVNCQALVDGEPINVCLDLSIEENMPYLKERIDLLFTESVRGISCYNLDQKTNQIVGSFLFVDLWEEYQILHETHTTNNRFLPIEEAYAEIHRQYANHRFPPSSGYKLEKGMILKVLMRGVNTAYRNQGLASEALERAINLAKARGYSYIISETSSHYTKKNFLSKGGVIRGGITYSEWKDSTGVIPFREAPKPHKGMYLMEIKL